MPFFATTRARRRVPAMLLTGLFLAASVVTPARSQVDTTITTETVDFCYPISNCKFDGGHGDMLAMTKTQYAATGSQCINQVRDVTMPKSTSRQLDIANKPGSVSGGAKATDVVAAFITSAQIRSQIKPCLEVSDGASGRWEYTVSITWAG